MTQYLELKSTDCKHCFKCIRNCPVKAIRFADDQAAIMQEDCVLCGECYVSCPQRAKHIRSDIEKAQALIKAGGPVIASLAPSFAANYPGSTIESMRTALLALGFAGVEETALGATLVKQRYASMVDAAGKSMVISTCCHTVNMLIEQYYPELLPCMAPVISPMQAHAHMIRRDNPGASVVFIGPCISKKAEAERFAGAVDCVLVFQELDQWLEQENSTLPSAPLAQESDAGRARLFPIPGGILRTMKQKNPAYHYIAVDGMDNCVAALKDMAAGKIEHCFVEMSACSGSCICGPGMSGNMGLIRGKFRIDDYACAEDFSVAPLPEECMDRQFQFRPRSETRFGEQAVLETLRKIGKTKPEHELNCGGCGYDTCREKAQAVLRGNASLTMCLPYMMSKAQSLSDIIIKNTPNGIVVLNEALEIQQINATAQQILNVKHEEDVLGKLITCLMEPDTFVQALETGGLVQNSRLYLAEYDRYVMLKVTRDAEYGLLIGIMRDITEAEAARAARLEAAEHAVRVTDEVIRKQMHTVQEIASLLGETTAETKIALTKLKETLRNE